MKKQIIRALSFVFGRNTRITEAYLKNTWRKYIRSKHRYREIDLIIGFLDAIKKNNGVLIDVGAHVGGWLDSFLFKDWVIYAFEPDPDSNKVTKLKMLSELKNVSYINKACSNKSGEILPFYASAESNGISSLHSFHSTHKLIGEVGTITLSDFIEDKKIENVRILKIDTEGHDLFVLEGFPWEKIIPSIIFCEFEDIKTISLGYDYKKLGDYLLSKGYKVFVSEWYPVHKYGERHTWRKIVSYPCELENPRATGNFICIDKIFWEDKYSNLITGFQVKS